MYACGSFRLPAKYQFPSRSLLSKVVVQFAALVRELVPAEVAIEEAFFGKSVQAALRIGEARGVVLAEAARSGIDVFQYPPARVKRCVAGHGAARKDSVASMLRQMLPAGAGPLCGDLPADATDAVAVAWTRMEQQRSPLSDRVRKRPRGLADGDTGQ